MSKELIQVFLEKYFNHIPYDGFDTVHYLDELDENLTPNQLNKTPNPYQNWQDVPFDYLNYHFTGIGQLDPKGFLFYTPAIILQTLQHYEERKSSLMFTRWLYKLKDELEDKKVAYVTLFNQEQLLIILMFLQYCTNAKVLTNKEMKHLIFIIEQLILNHPKDTL